MTATVPGAAMPATAAITGRAWRVLAPISYRPEHRDHVPSGQHLPDGRERHVERSQQADRQRLTGLLGPVVAVAGARIHPRWPQPASSS